MRKRPSGNGVSSPFGIRLFVLFLSPLEDDTCIIDVDAIVSEEADKESAVDRLVQIVKIYFTVVRDVCFFDL